MAIKRYKADADTTIVNAFQPGLVTRGTGANMGEADVSEIFSIYGRESTGSQELSRMLTKFSMAEISADRTAGKIPASGSVSFYLRLFNAEHSKTVPRDYKLVIQPVLRSWQEGVGLDLETYKDLTKGNTGANWMSASNTTPWTAVGGDYRTLPSVTFEQSLSTGLEDLNINITSLVEQWIDGTYSNNGVGVRLSSSYEAQYSSSTGEDTGSLINNVSGATKSYYTKRFFARGTQFFFKRPVLEARWNSVIKDDRGDFYYSSSLAPGADNLNVIYLYNYVRGRLTNIPVVGTGPILVSLYSGSYDNTAPSGSKLILYDGGTNVTGGYKSTGIYTASVSVTSALTPLTTLYDVWHSGSNIETTTGVEYFTGSITPLTLAGAVQSSEPVYYLNITNLKDKYRNDETARLNLYIRDKYWNPTIYTVANSTPESTTMVSASYRIFRVMDAFEAIPYGTGSEVSTQMSYDISGNYFDFDMNLLEPGYAYALKFAFYDTSLVSWVEQPEVFKFRVEDYEY